MLDKFGEHIVHFAGVHHHKYDGFAVGSLLEDAGEIGKCFFLVVGAQPVDVLAEIFGGKLFIVRVELGVFEESINRFVENCKLV